MRLGLETDDLLFGIAGYVEVALKDQKGSVIATYHMDKCAIPGKKWGKARIADFVAQPVTVPTEVASKVTSMEVSAVLKDDNAPQPLGIGDYSVHISIHFGRGD